MTQGAKKEEERKAREAEEARLAELARAEAESAALAAAARAEAARKEQERQRLLELQRAREEQEDAARAIRALRAERASLEEQVRRQEEVIGEQQARAHGLVSDKKGLGKFSDSSTAIYCSTLRLALLRYGMFFFLLDHFFLFF